MRKHSRKARNITEINVTFILSFLPHTIYSLFLIYKSPLVKVAVEEEVVAVVAAKEVEGERHWTLSREPTAARCSIIHPLLVVTLLF